MKHVVESIKVTFVIVSVDFNVRDQVPIKLSAVIKYWKEKWEYNETIHQTSRKPIIQLGGKYCTSTVLLLTSQTD
jgi:hypothetical protein